MSMTRSDFLAISGALRAVKPNQNEYRDNATCCAARQVWREASHSIASAIAAKTPAGVFDKRRFLTNCGLTAEG